MPKPKPPSLRRSQAITTYGPGSIVDLRQGSFMMAGVDFWPENDYIEIHEPNLERALRIKEFRMPMLADASEGKDLPAVVFPEWMVCPKCNRLATWKQFGGVLYKPGQILRCPDCNRQVYPARLVVACRKGHIQDFPWIEWAHRKSNPEKPVCSRPALRLRSMGLSSSLSDLIVVCEGKMEDGTECGARASLSGATQEEEFKGWFTCSGKRPWLMDQESCDQNIRPLQRGASNVYFSSIVSSLSIPPWSKGIYKAINNYWSLFRGMKKPESIRDTIDGMSLPARLKMDSEEIVQAILERQALESGEQEQLTESEIRWKECQALRRKTVQNEAESDFYTEKADIPDVLKGMISRVMLVERLREVRALLGFSRIDSPDPGSKIQSTNYAPISKNWLDWRPALEVRGEGIYLELDEVALEKWQNDNKQVATRAANLNDAYKRLCDARGWTVTREITPRFVLIHSLAHCLIRQLSLESGYSSASLRERLYCFEPGEQTGRPGIAGLLIYTSTPDAEGSLGGLVRQGLPKYLTNTFLESLNEASWCSSDPLCIEGENTGPDGTNMAACHACLLLSETCCEEFNRFLDRAMIVGTLKDPLVGFFARYLEG